MSTLAYHKKRPGTVLQTGLKDVPAKFFAERSKDITNLLVGRGLPEHANPEGEAITFYLTNAAMAEVRARLSDHEPLGDFEPIVQGYYERLNLNALRMFYYLLWICTRETRHCYPASYAKITEEYGNDKGVQYLKKLHGKDSDGAVKYFKENPPDMTIGEYTRHMVIAFSKGDYSGGYGGAAWAKVAKCLDSYVQGETTIEMMMDTAFTLAHNNGPIFNKGMLYGMYDKTSIIRILDVQRAGMMPQYVDSHVCKFITPEHVAFRQKCNELFGGTFGGLVDWQKVQELGAVGHYAKAKEFQAKVQKNYGPKFTVKGAYIVHVDPNGKNVAVDTLTKKRSTK